MTQAQKGTFLQLPSVFIETCDLPETAQIMYIRMLHSFGYKGIYTGSLRKLAHVVRMSKSTVDRMLDILTRSHLISRGNAEASETTQSILQISLDPEYLWNMNINYCTSLSVPIWDTYKEGEVSQDRTKCPKLGRAVPVAGQSVPTRTLKRATNITKTNKITKEDSLVISASAESDAGASFLSSLSQFEETLKDVQNGQTPLQASVAQRREEEPVKEADTSKTPAITSAVNDTTPGEKALQEIPTPEQPTKTLFPAAQPPHNSKTHKKDNRKISVLSVPKVPPRVIREAIDAIRGYGLDQEGPIKHQGVILKEWCQKHTLEDFQHVIEHLTKGRCSNEKHQWWREKNHMKTFFNAAKLAELTPDILSELGHIPKPEAPPEVAPSVEEPKIVGWTPVRQIYPPKGVTVTYG